LILSRLFKSIKSQDWLAVSLELLILILGIYLGFQVTEWQNERQKHQAEAQLLSRLVEDLQNLKQSNQKIIDSHSQQLDNFEKAINFAKSSNAWEQEFAIWRKQIEPVMGYDDPVVELPVYEEIVATAQLSMLKNPELRTQLTRFKHQLNSVNESNQSVSILYGQAYQQAYYQLIDIEMFPERVHENVDDRRSTLIRSLLMMRRTVRVVRFFTQDIVDKAERLEALLIKEKSTRDKS